jgi:RNA polymerase sigma-70 factor, ECF subfamily
LENKLYNEGRGGGNIAVLDPRRSSRGWMRHPGRTKPEVYLSPKPVEFYSFDDGYMERLRSSDPATEIHFTNYFEQLMEIKLRGHKLPSDAASDIQQETFSRVLDSLRTGAIREPERLGPYVNSVCNHVLLEKLRDLKVQHEDVEGVDVPDPDADLEERMIADENSEMVRTILKQLPERDRKLLRSLLLGDDKDEICREMGVSRAYLRVLIHRAVEAFKALYKGKKGPGPGLAPVGARPRPAPASPGRAAKTLTDEEIKK